MRGSRVGDMGREINLRFLDDWGEDFRNGSGCFFGIKIDVFSLARAGDF